MNEETCEEVDDGTGIIKPLSAYHHYSKANSSIVKDELLKEGKDGSLGAVVSIVSARWKSLGSEERSHYEELALDDRKRYETDCSIRDEEVLLIQEERRKQNAMTETETRMRHSTMANTDATTKADVPRKKREISAREQEDKTERKMARDAIDATIKKQHDEIAGQRMEQAQARLNFLLSQSDIFSHFGKITAEKPIGNGSQSSSSSSSSSSSAAPVAAAPVGRGRGRRAAAQDALDEDEKAMLEDEEGDEDGGDASAAAAGGKHKQHHRILTEQPRLVSGGAMRSYQLEGLNWMIRLKENGINGILADEMGLGKTLQSISVVAYCSEYLNIHGPHLIMVPKTTLSNWMNEFKRWCPSVRVTRFHGNKDERQHLIQTLLQPGVLHEQRSWDVLVTTYEVVNLEKNALSKIAWRYLIIDEAHRLKNEVSQFSQTVRMLNAENRLLLTGTPLQNNLHELWALLNFLLPDVFASAEQFDEWFDLDVDDLEAKQRIISQLHKLLRPFMLRRLKVDVEKSLPPKTETILFTGLSAVQKQLYKQILMRDIDAINSAPTSNSNGSRTAILNIVMQLRKCCNHPYLFPGVEDRTMDPMGDHLINSCGKMVLLDKLLVKMQERDHRVLIFSQMTRMLDILEDYLFSRGYQYCRIDGNTTYEEREDRIADFNRPNSTKFIFLLSTRAGGLGINLQTADTVILYDSDWNPQADLQAQDRAHRIGQKKPVQVFRLVTDESVEVKVVERAQQKLKLDAMVVQQGRLQEKERKLSKNELLDTIRFGADKVFKSKESAITDDDIELILKEGRKRTDEINDKMQKAEKGDIYDFRLDGGMSTQVWEGKDYSDAKMRDEMNTAASFGFLDPGKRERKAIASYSESTAKQGAEEAGDKRPKLPRHLRLNRMEDWQFHDKKRLQELQEEEIKLFDVMVDRGDAPQVGMISKFVVLPPALHEEKTRLLGEAFGDWTKVHFNNFVRASAKHGRKEYEKLAKDVGRPVEEVKRYADMFWKRGAVTFTAGEWERTVKQIEKGEKRLEEIQRLTTATAKLISLFEDPWEQLTFRNVGNQGRLFNAVEDRFLLCLTHLHGYGSWDLVRSSIRRCERFRFDFYLQSCSADALGKRCELLMKAAERELAEIERKKQAADSMMTATGTGPRTAAEVNADRVVELEKQIDVDTRRLANIRSQLQKTKQAPVVVISAGASDKPAGAKSSSTATIADAPAPASKKHKASASSDTTVTSQAKPPSSSSSSSSANFPAAGREPLCVPEGLLPELCKLLKSAGPDGVNKVVNQFIINHPKVSKRQVELKIQEVSFKDKVGDDTCKVWHIRPEYERYLSMENSEPEPVAVAAGGADVGDSGKAKATKKRKTVPENPADPSVAPKPKTSKPVKEATSSSSSSSSSKAAAESGGDTVAAERTITVTKAAKSARAPASTTPSSATAVSSADNKSKQDKDKSVKETVIPSAVTATPTASSSSSSSSSSSHSGAMTNASTPGSAAAATGKEPKKGKSAFSLFVKARRADAEAQLGADANTESLKKLILSMWQAADDSVKQLFVQREEEEKAKYEVDYAAWCVATGECASKRSRSVSDDKF